MTSYEPSKIRNVAIIGHRGTGKTSLVEALLFQGGAVNRLGTVEQQTTVSDWEEEEHKRQMSLAASLCHLEWQGRKINILDTPGDPGFQADTIAALHVVEGAIVVVSAVAGVEVQTTRSWERCNELGISRLILVNMLDRERADFFGTYEQLRAQLSERCIAIEIPIGQEHELSGVVDLLHMRAYDSPEGEKEGEPKEIPNELAAQAAEYREELVDAVVETDEKVMERYLEGEEITGDELAGALKNAVARGELFPVACGAATKNLGAAALLDLLVEGVPSPAKKPLEIAQSNGGTSAFVFKTLADPFAGRITLFRVLSGQLKGDSTLLNARTRSKERVGQLLELQGKDHTSTEAFEAGDIGAVAKLKETATGDLLLSEDQPVELPSLDLPQPVMSFAITPKAKGDEEKMGQALRRLAEEDQTLVLRRDEQTGEQLLAGMSQMHVEVAVERMKRRFGVDVELQPPRVPYLETIRKESRAQGRYKKQTGGRGQFGDCHIVLEPLEGRVGYEFVDKIVGGVVPQSFRPAVDKGIQEAMVHGELAGAPVQGVRVTLVDGSYHTVDSSEMAFKIAGSMAFKAAYEKADPVLLEPIMQLEATVPDESVGTVNGDLNSRRGRLQGMDARGGMTLIRAEVPMSEVLTYSQSLTSMTGGRGDYSVSFLRYEEVPAHVAERIVEQVRREREEAKAS
ncbi:MAG TPA: elongation factor G [Gaiellaceae bacterium]|jgi:elongation factor G|nr:elongation factor G [Gaiellaceae bacterium]